MMLFVGSYPLQIFNIKVIILNGLAQRITKQLLIPVISTNGLVLIVQMELLVLFFLVLQEFQVLF